MATLDPVVIEFALKGVNNVMRAFDTLSKKAASSESEWARSSKSFSQQRMRDALNEARLKEKLAIETMRERGRAERQSMREAGKLARQRVRDAEKAAKDAIKADERRSREIQRIANRERREHERHLQQMVRADEQAARRRVAAERAAERSIGRERERAAKSMYNAGARGVSRIARIGSRVGLGLARGVMQVGGGFGIADSVQRETDLAGASAQLAASTDKSVTGAGHSNAGLTSAEVRGNAKSISREFVMDQSDVVKGFDKFKELTGNTRQGMAIAPEIAKLSNALGADFSELMSNAGDIAAKNENLGDKDIIKLARVQAAQGRIGAVELRDFAKYGSRTVAAAGLFGGDASENIATASAMAQLARKHGSAAKASEATMAAMRFSTDLAAKSGKLRENLGIDVRDGKGTMRDARGIITDIIKKTKGDVTKLADVGITARGNKVLEGAASLYRGAGGGEAGEKAIQKFFDSMTKGLSDQEVEHANKERLAEVDKQLESVMQNLRMSVGEALLPELQKLIPLIAEWTPKLVSLLQEFSKWLSWASSNPWKALVGVLTASIGAEVAKAKIADVIRQMLRGGAPGGGVGGGGVPGAGVGNTTRALGVGMAAAGVIYNAGTKYADGTMAAEDLTAKVRAWNRGDRDVGVSPEAAQQMISGAQRRLDKGSGWTQVANMIMSPFDESAGKDYARYKGDQALVDNKDLIDAIRESTAATKQLAASQQHKGSEGNRNGPINNRGGGH